MLAILVLALAGCGTIERLTGESARKQARAEEAKTKVEELQLKVMRFSDTYSEQIVTRTVLMLKSDTVSEMEEQTRLALEQEVLEWQLAQVTSAFQIAAGPRPAANAFDMVALVRISRRLVARQWQPKFGAAVEPLLKSMAGLEGVAWRLLDPIATPDQQDEIRGVLDRALDQNPDLQKAAFVRFTDFANNEERARVGVSPGLLGIIGLDPTAGLDPAVREVEQTRQLAERAVFFFQRLPTLVELQLDETIHRLDMSSDTQRTLDAVERVGLLAEALAKTNDELPQMLAREREAAIDQVMTNLASQQDQMLSLATELRQALEAGATTADKLDTFANSVDHLVARFKPEPGESRPQRKKPFDVNEWTQLMVELAATAEELQKLAGELNEVSPRFFDRAEQMKGEVRGLVDYVFLRLLLLIGAALVAAIVYRVVTRRLRTAD